MGPTSKREGEEGKGWEKGGRRGKGEKSEGRVGKGLKEWEERGKCPLSFSFFLTILDKTLITFHGVAHPQAHLESSNLTFDH